MFEVGETEKFNDLSSINVLSIQSIIMQNQQSVERDPVRIFWKDGHNDRGTDCVPWIVEPVTQATFERLLCDYDCTFTDFQAPHSFKTNRQREPEIKEPTLLDDGEADIIDRHDDSAEAKGSYPRQGMPAWFQQPSGSQTASFECNGRRRVLHQRKFSNIDDIASKVSKSGSRVFYDDPHLKEMLFGKRCCLIRITLRRDTSITSSKGYMVYGAFKNIICDFLYVSMCALMPIDMRTGKQKVIGVPLIPQIIF